MLKNRRVLIFIYLFAVLIFIIHLAYTKTAVYGDGRFYYSYLPTYLLEHTLSFTESFSHFNVGSFMSLTGPANIYPLGPALFWSIPFTIANLILIPFGRADGYGIFYEIFIGMWNITFVFIGIYFIYKTLLRFFDKNTSVLTSIGIFTTTNLLFYGAFDVINSHSASFFFASVFLYLFTSKRTLLNSILIGISIGALALIRSQDYLFLIFPLIEIIKNKKNILSSILTILTAFIIFIPQIILWHVYYGGWLVNPYLKAASFNFLNPHLAGVLFNSNSGIVWTPIIFLCIYGLLKYTKINLYLGLILILLIILQIYLISSWSIWWEGASYSARMLISSLPFLSIGLASFLNHDKLKNKKIEIISVFSLLNFILILFFLKTY